MGRQYRVCRFCGDRLDAGEICECRRETEKKEENGKHEQVHGGAARRRVCHGFGSPVRAGAGGETA